MYPPYLFFISKFRACANNAICIIVFLCLILCSKEATSQSIQSPELKNAHQKWKAFINQKSDSLSLLYTDTAIKILKDENILEGKTAIKEHYLNEAFTIKSIRTDTVLMANEKRGLEYEMGEYVDHENRKYKHIIIWETKDGQKYRVFEFMAKVEDSNKQLDQINARRDLWMKLCNSHNAEALIKEMYSENTLYFNHKPLVKGRALLVREYDYMNRENYKLELKPMIVEMVNDQMVFEIGQCKGSYNGKYIIIWRKEANGNWEVFIDSNI